MFLVDLSEMKNIVSLGNHVFTGCTNLKYLILPNRISTIASDAFINVNLESLVYKGRYD